MMARISILSILSAVFFSIALALPIDVPENSIIEWVYNASAPYPTSAWYTIPVPTDSILSAPEPTFSASQRNESGLTNFTSTLGTAPTGNPYPTATGTRLVHDKRGPELLALEKRRAFEGPRHRHFPHYYPQFAAAALSDWLGAGTTLPHHNTAPAAPYPTATNPTGSSYQHHRHQPFTLHHR